MYSAIKKDELTSIREISEAYSISSNHLMKVVHHLGKGGFLHTIRGKNGGFRLGKPAESIKLGELIRYTEDDLSIVECLGDSRGVCKLIERCSFGHVMTEALDAFLGVADNYTIADMVENMQPIDFLKEA